MSQITTSVILHTQRPLQEGIYPVRLRVYCKPKRKYFSLPLNAQEMMYASEEEWEKIHSPKPRGKHKEMKIKIAYYEKRAEDVIKEMEQSNTAFSFERFRTRFFGEKQNNTVFHLFREVIEKRREEGRIGTALSYGNALSNLKKFTKNKDMFFADIDEGFLKKWEKKILAAGSSVNTVGIYMRSLRTVCNEAIKKGYIKSTDYPFRYYKIPAAKKAKRALTKEDILKIYGYETVPQSAEGKAKNYFLFSYLMQGMNFTDIAYLKNENIADGRISYYRHKTSRSVGELTKLSVKLTDQLLGILAQLRTDSEHPKDYVFPVLRTDMSPEQVKATIKQFIKTTNKWLKRIGEKLELPLDLTTYVARHSYATVLKRSGVSTSIISESLAHSSEKTTQNYLGSFEDEVFDEVNKNLL